ncbi:hypothetical protein [Streptomyces sasae]|uniref:hypothetical protein n=1 Tax=Streptomyces sasae TaxID=1266772 RepID=UPI00292EFC23|nr:hypothetical protein [Streptomyces sasae]
MTEIVVYELDRPAAAPGGTQRRVRRVHVAPAAPGSHTVAGPRTLCGKDTFAMETTGRRPSEHPGEPWYPTEHASVACPDCDAVMEV